MGALLVRGGRRLHWRERRTRFEPVPDGRVCERWFSGDVHDTPSCDITFDLPTQQGCAASSGQAQHEGITIVGPSSSTNTSTAWTVAITWTAVAA
jgi:hypothetical protein